MTLRTKYILFVILLHLIALVLSYYIFEKDKVFFIVSEVFIILSLFLSWQLYKGLIEPLKLLMQGAEAIRDKDFTVKFVLTGRREMDELIKIYNRMIDELRMERTRQEQQHLFLEKLIHTSPTGILVLDYDDHVQQVNPRALQLLGLQEQEVAGQPIDAVVHPVLTRIKQLQSGEASTFTFNGIITYKLQKSHFIDRGFPRHFVMIEELTAEILAAEKKAYERVIRMMAHEVNNTIGPVNSILQSALSKEKIWKDQGNHSLQDAIRVAIDRNYNLNMFMRNFADVVRLPTPNKTSIDLHPLIHSIARLMQTHADDKGIRFEYHLENGPFCVEADEQLMEQVLINIVKNAIEAIEEKGIVSFTTKSAGPRQLIISDNGKGISSKDAGYLFSPFFSTKKDGQGIGLTLVKEILLKHGFVFSLQTNGAGETLFTIGF